MRSNLRHIAIAVVFLFTQICAAAAMSDHLGDPLHTGDDCTICSTIGNDLDDLPPPAASGYVVPSVTTERAIPLRSANLTARPVTSRRARAPPLPA